MRSTVFGAGARRWKTGSLCARIHARGFRPQPRNGPGAIADAANGFDDGLACLQPTGGLIPLRRSPLRGFGACWSWQTDRHRFPTSTRAKPDGGGSISIGDGACRGSILPACVADGRQHHALAAPVFKAATRFAALTDPVRFASTTADGRFTTPMPFMFNPSGGLRSRQAVVLPVFQPSGETMSLAFASAPER